MKRMSVPAWLCRAAGLAALALFGTAWAPGLGAQQVASSGAAATGSWARVIVSYRPQAAVERAHPLRRGAPNRDVRQALQRRADLLAAHAGVNLATGRAVGERAHVVMARGLDSQTLARRLARHPDVEWAEVDQRRRALWVPNDPYFTAGPSNGVGAPAAGQWYLRAPTDTFKSAINAQAAWDRSRGQGVVVAVLDTGALLGNFEHLDLKGQWLPGYDFIKDSSTANDGDGRDTDPSDPGDGVTAAESGNSSSPYYQCEVGTSSWHGTRVGSIIAALTDNALGMAGVAPQARILPVRVLGKCGGWDSDIAAGMRWAAGIDQPGLAGSATPAQVLNMSLGGDPPCSATYAAAVSAVLAKGAVIVAAAGNSTGHAVGAPAVCPGVIAVAGLRHFGSKVGFSDLGPEIKIAAPAGNCVNTGAGEPCLYPIVTAHNAGTHGPVAGSSPYSDSFDYAVGTSFATPLVAGTAALMLAAQPKLTPTEVLKALQDTARAFPTSGADPGAGQPAVQTCQPPTTADQLQCYCTTGLCGAGMLDAAAAVALVARPVARIDVITATPTAGTDVQLSATGSLTATGRSIVGYAWVLVDGGGVVTAFSSPTNAATATFNASAAGTVTVRVTITDDTGATSSVDQAVAVAAKPASDSGSGGSGSSGSGSTGGSAATGSSSGGGAVSGGWLWGLLTAAALLWAVQRVQARRVR